ncbi:MAG: glycosyltransferase family 2 protein [Nitrospira sp.]|nr:glycosyltransferase family 2 protein [Nitrospira sp.]
MPETQRNRMELSLIIPCYNEAGNLPELLKRCVRLVETEHIEVILVDNGSTDESPMILRELIPRHPRCRTIRVEQNKGYGFGILSGLQVANGHILGWTHADLQTDPFDAQHGRTYFDRFGDDIFVKGRRYGRPISDQAFTVGMSLFESVLLRRPLWDINAQPTLFSRRFYETWKHPPNDFSLDLYAYFHAKRSGLFIHRFPVRFEKRGHGMSHWNVNWKAKRKFIARTVLYSVQLKKTVGA